MSKNILIIKNNGEQENFDPEKVKKSILNSGADLKTAKKISQDLIHELKPGMTTEKIYKIVREKLKASKNKKIFLRYNLPLAIAKMGPEGFAFEKFIGEVFRAYNYNPVYVGKKINGKCIIHEMDIVAEKGNEKLTAELKFHNSRSKKSDLKVVLYMKARFDDILNSGYYGDFIPHQLIITNTKFTTNAKTFAKCAGVKVLSWNFPESSNLHDFILKSGIHPLTALTTISNKAKEYFIKRKIVSCRSLMQNEKIFLKENPFIPKSDFAKIEEEISAFCHSAK